MELMASRWNDDRLDDLEHQVDELGRRMDQGFALQRQELNARFDRMEAQFDARFERIVGGFDDRFEAIDKRFEAIDKRFDKVDSRFEGVSKEIRRTQEMAIGLHATITRLSVTLLAVMAGLVVTRLA